MKLSHIGIAVKSIEESGRLFERLLGRPRDGTEEVADQQVRLAFFHLEDVGIELTEASSDSSPIAIFIERRGEGIHHLSFEVGDIRGEIGRLKGEGFQLIDEQPRRGAGGSLIAFLHPRSTNGVLVELTQSGSPGKSGSGRK